MQFLYDSFVHRGEDGPVEYRDLVAEGYVEPADFSEVARGLHGRALERALAIRGIFPRPGGASGSHEGP